MARPWPTADQQWKRVARLIVVVSIPQYILGGLQLLVGGIGMVFAWWIGGIVAAIAAIQIEKYIAGRR